MWKTIVEININLLFLTGRDYPLESLKYAITNLSKINDFMHLTFYQINHLIF